MDNDVKQCLGCIFLVKYEGHVLGYCKRAKGRVYIYSLACKERIGEEECW